VIDCCLTPNEQFNFSAISWREQTTLDELMMPALTRPTPTRLVGYLLC